ncbi:NAD-dependent epimerase/dehydratase family protein [Agrococcus sp. ARC_14]|uniref:NAD-dependent epimerase/dehydratase family protein n=1 Tax=Agrococcus sp. ARC_14 TaxID=2919927 RepID=UPI001F05DE68|nr:NAD-dependent epimerase/dehydratase family protein [Agrococcus sp. ARC_14]MCH1884006.1 NAD-dependent epimerase/dehydratase family protein [Agrococcus sp. ARC_14]
MIVLITGASGFLGRAVAAELVAAGHEVRALQRRPSRVPGVTDVLGSVTDAALVARAAEGAEGVVHLAAKVSLAGEREEFRLVNVEGTRTLLDAAEHAGVRRFVQVSSPSVAHLGASLAGVGAEPASPEHARGDYARTKAEGELLALSRDSAAMRVVAVRPHIVWGPGDTQLIERIVDRARRGRVPLLSGGTALIDTTYVDNAATGIVAALHRAEHAHGNAYVLTNGEPRPVADLLAGICLAAGVRPPHRSIPAPLGRAAGALIERIWAIPGVASRAGGDEPPMTRFLAEQLSTAHWFDQRDTRRDLDWMPTVSIDAGLRRLAEHYRAAR